MSYRVVVPSDVRRYVRRLDRQRQQQVTDRLTALGEDPYGHAYSKWLHGQMAGRRSSDVGGLRILYTVEDEIRVVDIIDIGPRGDIYKR